MKPDESSKQTPRREWLAVALVTLIGAGLRAWPIGGLGLTHFDEGIYALVASSSLSFQDLIPYAPPGFPILGRLAFAIFGSSDVALILVSQIAGTLTIPVVAWLGRRTFGPGAGFVSSVFCAFSGPQIAFSRMALTDASFLLAWLLALGSGLRFLERPGFVRALVMGLAVGLAQEFKYNGWLTGGIVIGTALLGIVVRPDERTLGSMARTFGWGGFAVVVAGLVVWPWFAFVEGHGGYSALLRHQQSYLGGFGAWWPDLMSQADQSLALSGGPWLIVPALALVSLTPWVGRSSLWGEAIRSFSETRRIVLVVGFGVLISFGWPLVAAPELTGFLAIPWLLRRTGGRLVVVWWLALLVTSPFYHPYARLWLPFQASHWLLMGWIVAEGFPQVRVTMDRRKAVNPAQDVHQSAGKPGTILLVMALSCWIALTRFVNQGSIFSRNAVAQSDLFAPSNSLRQASQFAAFTLDDEVQELRLLVRWPVTYYLAERVALRPMAGLEDLAKPASSPRTWALVDSALVRSETGQTTDESVRRLLDRYSKNWEVVQRFPTILSLPTLLDLDPTSARSSSADRNCSLWLLRPRRPGGKPR